MINFKNIITKNNYEFKFLDISALLIAGIILLPILNFSKEGLNLIINGQFSLGITGKEEIVGSIKMLLLTSCFGGTLGLINGWLLSNCEFPFRKFIRICQLIPLAAPAYLTTAILQDVGSIMGFQINGIWWGVLILSISTYPYVFILTNESFNKFGTNQILASRGLGADPWKSFFKIALPMALPSFVTGVSLMCMEVMNELGTFELLNIPTISTGIKENWNIDRNPNSGIALSLVALIIVFALIFIEKLSRQKTKRWSDNPSNINSQNWTLKGYRSYIAIIISSLPALLSLGIPAYWIILNTDQLRKGLNAEIIYLTFRTLGLGLTAALLTVIFSILVCFSNRWNKALFIKVSTFICGIGYAIPGTVLAIFLLTIVNNPSFYLYLLVFGYITRFLTISKGALDSALERISPNIDEAAKGLGASQLKVIKKIHIPLLKGPIFVGTLLVFIDTIKELPISFIVRPTDFDTLSVRLYQYASDERLAEAIIPAILIILLGLLASSTLIPNLENKRV